MASTAADWAIRTLEALYCGPLTCDRDFARRTLDAMAPGVELGWGCGLSLVDMNERRYRFLEVNYEGAKLDLSRDRRLVVRAVEPHFARAFLPLPLNRMSAVVGPEGLAHYHSEMRQFFPRLVDSVGLTSQPGPGLGLAGWAILEAEPSLDARRRSLLWCLSFHLEAAVRLRLGRSPRLGSITPDGKLELAGTLPKAERARLQSQVRDIERVRLRANRKDASAALRLWQSLVAGHITLFEEQRGRHAYQLYENPPRCAEALALSTRERSVLEQVARGVMNKELAWTLGLSQTQVSRALGSAALKLGLRRPRDAVHLASLILSPANMDTSSLTEAEQAVLHELRTGCTNAEIARSRGTSVRTVANQVASILKKTQRPSRRSLLGLRHA